MTYLSGTVKVPKDHTQIYPYLLNLVVVTASVGTAITLFAGGAVNFKPGDVFTAECRLFPINLHLPLHGPIRYAVTGNIPDEIHIEFVPRPARPKEFPVHARGARKVILNLITPIFVDFYENSILWVRQKFGDDSQDWPSIWNFGRVVRNAISHRGEIYTPNQNSPPVTWHHVTYTPADHGKEIIGGDFQFADMLVLMFELSDELDRLGYPAI